VGPLSWDYLDPGVDLASNYYLLDAPRTLTFDYDGAAFARNDSLGILLLHQLNAGPAQAETVDVLTPTLDAGGPYAGNEGGTINLDASGSTDPNGDPLTISWDLDHDGTFETNGATTPLQLGDGPATRTVGLRVTDGNEPPITRDVSVNVANVAPTVTASAIGSPATGVRVGATDPSAADQAAGFTYKVDVGANGSVEKTQSGGASLDIPLDVPAGTATPVRVTATDKDSAESTAVTVSLNGAPIPVKCVVPKLKGKTKKQAEKALEAANCRLGKVKKPKKKGKGKLVVSKQSPAAGTELAEDSAVKITLKRKKKRK
jgi:hypothetical protein